MTQTRLSDTQLVILSAAAQRSTMLALPFPKSVNAAFAQKSISSLIKQGLLAEIDADMGADPLWTRTDDGRGTTLVITEHGLAAIGIEQHGADTAPNCAPTFATQAPNADAAPETTTEADTAPASSAGRDEAPAPKTPKMREGTKQAKLIAMLRAPDGATIDEIATALEWTHHTVRGALAGALKKKLGLDVTSEKTEGRGRVYRLGREG